MQQHCVAMPFSLLFSVCLYVVLAMHMWKHTSHPHDLVYIVFVHRYVVTSTTWNLAPARDTRYLQLERFATSSRPSNVLVRLKGTIEISMCLQSRFCRCVLSWEAFRCQAYSTFGVQPKSKKKRTHFAAQRLFFAA